MDGISNNRGWRGEAWVCPDMLYNLSSFLVSSFLWGKWRETTGCRGYPILRQPCRHTQHTHTHAHQDKVFTNQGKHSPDQKIGVWVRMSAPPKIAVNEWFPTLLQKDDQFFDSLVGSKTKHLPCWASHSYQPPIEDGSCSHPFWYLQSHYTVYIIYYIYIYIICV